MYYMLCCDIATLRCTADDIEQVLSDFSTRYHKVSDNLWLFCAHKDAAIHVLESPNRYVVTHLLRKYTTPESSLFAFHIPEHGCYWELSDAAEAFLSLEEPDD